MSAPPTSYIQRMNLISKQGLQCKYLLTKPFVDFHVQAVTERKKLPAIDGCIVLSGAKQFGRIPC